MGIGQGGRGNIGGMWMENFGLENVGPPWVVGNMMVCMYMLSVCVHVVCVSLVSVCEKNEKLKNLNCKKVKM